MNLKVLLLGLGGTLLFTSHIMFAQIFLTAYLNPEKEILINIDSFKEADAELVLLIISTILGSAFLLFGFKTLVQNEINRIKNTTQNNQRMERGRYNNRDGRRNQETYKEDRR